MNPYTTFVLFYALLLGTIPGAAQTCRQPDQKRPGRSGEIVTGVILGGVTVGAEAASRTWGSQAGNVAESVIWSSSQERINNRTANSVDYATCESNETAREQIRSQERTNATWAQAQVTQAAIAANGQVEQAKIYAASDANRTAATTRSSSCGTAAGTAVCGEYKTPTQVGTGPRVGPLTKP